MQQLNRYLGFLQTPLLWKNQSLQGLIPFEFVDPERPIKTVAIKIPENEVLGKRVERFFEMYLRHSHRYHLIAKNLQVFEDKITIGELDFIIEDLQEQQLLHLELVYKFYVYDPHLSDTELECWIGPNKKDSLVQKIKKLQEKQLPLLYTREAKKLLKQLHLIPSEIEQRVAFFGNLFIPKYLEKKAYKHLNKACIAGFWISKEDFTESEYGNSQLYMPQKKDWMTLPKFQKTWKEYKAIQSEVASQLDQKKSPLLWMKSNGDSFARFFIVWW